MPVLVEVGITRKTFFNLGRAMPKSKISRVKFILCIALLFGVSPAYAQQSLFTTQVPQTSSATLAWDLGVSLTFDTPGTITALRFYKIAGKDPGPHTGHVWSSTGVLLATTLFVNETPSGWQQASIPPLAVSSGASYTVSVSSPSGANYALQPGGLPLVNGHISAAAGLYGAIGARPVASTPTNYFRDVVFTADAPIGTVILAPDAAAGGFVATLDGFTPGPYMLTVLLQDAAGVTTTSSLQITMPPRGPQ